MIITDTTSKVTVRNEGKAVLLIIDGKLVSAMPWEAAEQIGRALIAKARQAEEIVKHESITFDNAILARSGFPIGLSNHPKIMEDTKKEALHNRILRRFLPPPRIESKGVTYAPTIIGGKKNV